MPSTDDFSFRNPLDTVSKTLDQIEASWPGLRRSEQAPLRAALTDLGQALGDASGDFARGTVLTNFLYALDRIPSLPAAVQSTLDQARGPRMRSSPSLGSAAAHDLIQRINRLINASAPAEPAAIAAAEPVAPATTGSADPEPELGLPTGVISAGGSDKLVARALALVKAVNASWDIMSLNMHNIAGETQYTFLGDLQAASTDQQREDAANRFLDAIEGSPALNELLKPDTFRGDHSAEWQSVYSALENSPALAGLGREVEMAAPEFAMDFDDIEVLAANGGTSLAMEPRPVDALHQPFFTDVRFPGQVSTFEHQVPLVVKLTIDKPKESRVVERLDVEFQLPQEPELIEVVCLAEDFVEATGDSTRTITVHLGQDSQPAIFLLSPRSDAAAGTKRIVLDFIHRGRNLGHASFFTELIDRPSGLTREIVPENRLEVTELRTYDAEPVDLELRVMLGANKTQLMYMLHSPKGSVGYHWKSAGTVQLEEEPRLYLQSTINRLNLMARKGTSNRPEEQTADYTAALVRIGQELYDQVFSDELKREYAGRISELRKAGKITNVLITSDEPWIPWELLKPYQTNPETGAVEVDDDFLCASFKLSRWLAGRGIPDFVTIDNALIVAPKSNLPSVQVEIDYFTETMPGVLHRDAHVPLETVAEVLEALSDSGANLYHFSCHGNFDADNADESPLQLRNGERLAPSDVIGTAETGVVRSKPLIFLNACNVGQVGNNIRGLGGWAARFVGKGASAFIGGLWEVNDKLAAEFAITFYDKLWSGATLGDAFHAARAHLREMDPANPTWLAYTLYADPNGFARTPSSDD